MKSFFLQMFGWIGSVRSVVTMIVAVTFCWLAVAGRIDPKDFMLIVSLVFNFYFMNKIRVSSDKDKLGTPPAALAIIFILGLCSPVMAADLPINQYTDFLKKVPSIKTGVGYSFLDNKINVLSTFEVATYKNLNFELGYMADSENTGHKAVVVASYKLIALKDFMTVPVLDLIECNVGGYYGVGNIGAGNEQDYGVTATAINLKW